MKKRKHLIFLLVGCCVIISLLIVFVLYRTRCTTKTNDLPASIEFHVGEHNHKALWISLINLIATPEKYDEKPVMVEGVFRCEMESDRLYLSNDDYSKRISANAVSLDLADMDMSVNRKQLEQLNGRHVLIEGIFDYNDEGYINLYSGRIENINRIDTIDSE